jgi:hypothetical protein
MNGHPFLGEFPLTLSISFLENVTPKIKNNHRFELPLSPTVISLQNQIKRMNHPLKINILNV